MQFCKPIHMSKIFIIIKKAQFKFLLRNSLVTFNNTCVKCSTNLLSKFFYQNVSIRSLKNESNITGNLIN